MTLRKNIKRIASYLQKIQPNIIFLPQKDDLQPRHKLVTKLTLVTFKNINGSPRMFNASEWRAQSGDYCARFARENYRESAGFGFTETFESNRDFRRRSGK